MHIAIVSSPIDTGLLLARVASPAHGATSLFLGTVRELNDGRAVSGLEYSAYESMAASELRRIAEEASAQFDVSAIAIEHRIGALALGDISVAIAVAHAHRAPSLDACRYIIEALKLRVPIWKRELYVGGTREWIDPTASSHAGQGA
jgi:molybdopterin synthase catalytic subunit